MVDWNLIKRLMYRGKTRGDLSELEMKLCQDAMKEDPEKYRELKAEQDDLARASLNPLDSYWRKPR